MMSADQNNAAPGFPDNEGEPGADGRKESLAERSARLEAEALGLFSAQRDDYAQPPPGPSPEDIAQAQQLKADLEAAKDQMMRALAEVENIRKRAAKEREDASKFAVSSFAKDMLDIGDNLRRALEAVPPDMLEGEPRLKNLVEGIEATERTLMRSFEKHGIRQIAPMDEIFDPNFHEVMFEAPMPGKPAGTIIQVMETGYMLHDRLLRPARVGVVRDDGQGGANPGHPGGHIDTQA